MTDKSNDNKRTVVAPFYRRISVIDWLNIIGVALIIGSIVLTMTALGDHVITTSSGPVSPSNLDTVEAIVVTLSVFLLLTLVYARRSK